MQKAKVAHKNSGEWHETKKARVMLIHPKMARPKDKDTKMDQSKSIKINQEDQSRRSIKIILSALKARSTWEDVYGKLSSQSLLFFPRQVEDDNQSKCSNVSRSSQASGGLQASQIMPPSRASFAPQNGTKQSWRVAEKQKGTPDIHPLKSGMAQWSKKANEAPEELLTWP